MSRPWLLVGVVLTALLLAGCGDNRSADRKAMEVKFERLDYQMSTLETANAAFNARHLIQDTQRYIGLVHRYADLLGSEEAKRRLNAKADEVGAYCLPCAGVLTVEAGKF